MPFFCGNYMALEKEISDFLQVYPELYSIIKSKFFMEIIKVISEKLISFSELSARFPKIDADDLKAILNSLESLKIVSKATGSSEGYYAITKKGRLLLKKYAKIRKDLLIG